MKTKEAIIATTDLVVVTETAEVVIVKEATRKEITQAVVTVEIEEVEEEATDGMATAKKAATGTAVEKDGEHETNQGRVNKYVEGCVLLE